MSSVKHASTAFPCIRCFIRTENISSLRRDTRRLEAKIKVAYNAHKNFFAVADGLYRKGIKARAREKRAPSCHALYQYSLNEERPMLQGAKHRNVTAPSDHYSLFSVDPLHFLHFGSSKKLKECTVDYLLSQKKKTSLFFPMKHLI